jgi:ribosomal protein L34
VFVLRQYQDSQTKISNKHGYISVFVLRQYQDSQTKISNKHGYISVFVPRQYQDFKQTWLHFCVCSHLNMSMEYNYKITSNIPRKSLQRYKFGPEKKKEDEK